MHFQEQKLHYHSNVWGQQHFKEIKGFSFNKDTINWSKVTDTFDVKKWLTQYDVKNIIIIIRLLDKLDMFL